MPTAHSAISLQLEGPPASPTDPIRQASPESTQSGSASPNQHPHTGQCIHVLFLLSRAFISCRMRGRRRTSLPLITSNATEPVPFKEKHEMMASEIPISQSCCLPSVDG